MINREEYVQKLKHQIEQWNAQMAQWEATSRDAKDRYMKQLEQFRDKRDAAILGVAARRFPLRHLRVPLLDLVLQLLHVLLAVDHRVLPLRRLWHSIPMTDSLGSRAKFGVLAPSTNTSVQPEFDAMRPWGVTNHQ